MCLDRCGDAEGASQPIGCLHDVCITTVRVESSSDGVVIGVIPPVHYMQQKKKIIIGGEILALKPRIVFLGYRESMATITLKKQEPMNSRWREGVCSSY